MAKPNILIIDDEQDLVELLKFNLQKEGYLITVAYDGPNGLAAARKIPDLVILDLMLPGMDGLEVCRILKGDSATAGIPVLMLTAKGDETDIVVGLEMGGDDYLAKPFRMKELLARIKALLRRSVGVPDKNEIIQVGSLTLNRGSYEAAIGNKPVELTAFEFRILWTLAENAGRVLSRRQILGNVSPDRVTIDRTIDVHITKIREKLGPAGQLIETIRSVGYRLKKP